MTGLTPSWNLLLTKYLTPPNLLRRQIDESIIAGAHQLENVSGLKIRQIVDQESGGTSVSDVE